MLKSERRIVGTKEFQRVDEGRGTYAEKVMIHHAGARCLAPMLRKDGRWNVAGMDCKVHYEKGFRTLRNAGYTATHVLRMFRKYGSLMMF